MKPTRRDLMLATLGAIAPLPAVAQASRPLIVMMSAEDCPPCNAWKKNVLPEWKKMSQFSRVDFGMIEGYRIQTLDRPSTWISGKEYLPIYKAFLADMKRWTVNDNADVGFVNDHTAPRWFVIRDGQLEGVSVAWRRTFAKVNELLDRV
jgi:hypothetical protein